jgi:aminomethyltransferase
MPAREGAPIFNGATQIGVLTSGGFAPSLGFPIAMGYVTRDFAAPSTTVEIEVRGKRIAATVSSMPFIPNRYHRKGKTA